MSSPPVALTGALESVDGVCPRPPGCTPSAVVVVGDAPPLPGSAVDGAFDSPLPVRGPASVVRDGSGGGAEEPDWHAAHRPSTRIAVSAARHRSTRKGRPWAEVTIASDDWSGCVVRVISTSGTYRVENGNSASVQHTRPVDASPARVWHRDRLALRSGTGSLAHWHVRVPGCCRRDVDQ